MYFRLVGAIALTLGLHGAYNYHASHFAHPTRQLLEELTSAKGIHVTFTPRGASSSIPAGVAMHAVLYPRGAEGLQFDGRLSYQIHHEEHNYTLYDNKAYYTVEDTNAGRISRMACLSPNNVPPFHELAEALQNARVVDEVANADVTCDIHDSKLVEFQFAGEPYVFCSTPSTQSTDGVVDIHGQDLQASLRVLTETTEVSTLQPPASLDWSGCPEVGTSSASAQRSLLSSQSLDSAKQRVQDSVSVLTGGRRLSSMVDDECSCKGGLKKCLFVHGLGYTDGPTTDTFTEYFGNIHNQAKCCSSIQFLHLDTRDSTWYGDNLTSKLCDAASALSTGSDPQAIENVAIVAHSMGNLVFAGALMNKKCALADSSKWIALAGPMYGSASASKAVTTFDNLPPSLVENLCTENPYAIIEDPILKTLMFFGLCPTRTSLRSIVFKDSAPATPELKALMLEAGSTFKEHVSSSLCAVNAKGFASTDSIQLSTLGLISGHASFQNDGQVDFGSCHAEVSASKYQSSWNGGNFYLADINHLDATFRRGDGLWGESRKPVKWFNCQF
ncbi:hypothetical protein Poli38472_010991 [Pythium oligandrum]|uniref:Uncharacterized protein n=1 Tax=Pythium oligandrum TaxID=41045 RepID=A0A8K1CG60_PYTOL|nr:hypothetical protein Poli38472_010991 [Pythium oligandrum]|eukprot:TMW61928.1 hypothetical protein Poli38472_010991 [Pythium oligandrum]